MPSVSKKQQKFMGIVRSIQKGEQPASKFSKSAQKAAKKMKKSSVKKYAKTKHDDLPTKKEGVQRDRNNLAMYIIDLNNMLSQAKLSKNPKAKKYIKFIQQDIKDAKKKLSKLKEERDYKDEYKKFQSSPKAKKYRAELNKYNRQKGTYGNGDGKDASHKGGKIVGFENQSKNRGRAEKSRLRKEIQEYVDNLIDEKCWKGYEKKGMKTMFGKRYPNCVKKKKSEGLSEAPSGLVKKAIQLAKSMGGNMTGAVKKIERIKRGLSKHRDVKKALRKANESVNEKVDPEMKRIYQLLLKYGNSAKDAAAMIKKNLKYVNKTYRNSTPRGKAVALVGLQSLGENLTTSQIKKMRDEFDKTGELPPHLKKIVKAKKEFEKKFKVKDIVVPGLEWMSKIKEGTCGYGIDGKIGEEPAGPNLMKKIKKISKDKEKKKILKSRVKEEVKMSQGVQKFKKIVDTGGYAKIGGTVVDVMSATLFMTLYNKVNDDVKAKLNATSEKQLIRVLHGMWKKYGSKVKFG